MYEETTRPGSQGPVPALVFGLKGWYFDLLCGPVPKLQPRELLIYGATTPCSQLKVLFWKWLMIHKEWQGLVMGHNLEKSRDCCCRKQIVLRCRVVTVLVLAWVPFVEIRGRCKFSAVRKSNFSSWGSVLGNSSYACTDACAYASCSQENWVMVGLFWIKKYIFLIYAETKLCNSWNSVTGKKWLTL